MSPLFAFITKQILVNTDPQFEVNSNVPKSVCWSSAENQITDKIFFPKL